MITSSEQIGASAVQRKLSEAQQQLVVRNIARVGALAHKLAPRLPHLTSDDLRGAGTEGLIDAAMRYREDSGVPFAVFAYYRIRGAMLDLARRHTPGGRHHSRALRVLECSQSVLEQQATRGNSHNSATLTERVTVAKRAIASIAAAALVTRLDSLDPDELSGGGISYEQEQAVIHNQLSARLARVLGRLASEDRDLILAIYYRGLSMHDYANATGKHVSTISRQHGRVIAELSESLADLNK